MPVLATRGTEEREFRCEQWDSFPDSKWGWTQVYRDCTPDRLTDNVGYPFANTTVNYSTTQRARNGTSVDNEYFVVFGNDVGKEKAKLISNREIPLKTYQIHYNGGKTIYTDEKNTAVTPETARSILEIKSTTSALLLAPITRAQMMAMVAIGGMIVYVEDTFTDADGTITLKKHYGYDGTNWQALY